MNKSVSQQDGLDLESGESALTPPEIVEELDRFIISQDNAKRAVAIALRNRWRRLRVSAEIRDEITPKNIIMMGPTGVGKTEISRRLAKLVKAPFVKVEASKFTEVGYVGRDVESIIRDLAEVAHTIVREEAREKVREAAEKIAEERLLDLLLPGSSRLAPDEFYGSGEEEKETFTVEKSVAGEEPAFQDIAGVGTADPKLESQEQNSDTREKLCRLLREGRLDERVVEVEVQRPVSTQMQILGPQGFGEIEGQIKDMFASMVPRQRDRRKMPVKDARKALIQEAQESLIDHDRIAELAIERAEQTGIVFIDEVDKICGSVSSKSPDVSREGVQRDLLPLVEGSTVATKYGNIRTEHILFIASGAFHVSKPSDLMPEFQGRFPIRVELKSLTPEHFVRILTEPENALTRQYSELLKTEGVEIVFEQSAIEEIAAMTAEVNSTTENIGARRLYTLLEKVLEGLSYKAHDFSGQRVVIDCDYVKRELRDIVNDSDLSRFIL